MNRLTATQGKALVHLIASLRRDWQPAGIEAAVRKAAEDASANDVCVAAVRAAANPDAQTPGLIYSPGPHWASTPAGKRIVPTMCGVHPDERAANCQRCREEATPPPAGWRNRGENT